MAPLRYTPPFFLKNGHLLTVYPSLFRLVPLPSYKRERIPTPDDDFLDLDWSLTGSRRLLIISHGLEGHSRRPYVRGMARAANRNGIDALAWNFRGCSGEINRQLRFYHSGSYDDLETVIRHACATKGYERIDLVGFSMGGNQTVLYGARRAGHLPGELGRAVVFSVPMDLSASAQKLAEPQNKIYMRRFLNSLRRKIIEKHQRFPGKLDIKGLDKIRTFEEFDDRYTAPLHGFKDARDYWRRCSSLPELSRVQIPLTIVNARDDPFLTPSCTPEACSNPYVSVMAPAHGGHVGFVSFNSQKLYWSEQLTMTLLNEPVQASKC
ncbi:MAG: alpha/beta fold hydrolase [Calditrichaeota bacterium]|nr:MAG: alpha/beta fold hydrolase [Calditrichota bacterium]